MLFNSSPPPDIELPTTQASDSQITSVTLTGTLTKILDANPNRIKVILDNRSDTLCQYSNKGSATKFLEIFPDTAWIENEGASLEFWAKGNGELVVGVWDK